MDECHCFSLGRHDKKMNVKKTLSLIFLWKRITSLIIITYGYLQTGRFTYFGTDGIYEVRFVDMKRRYAQQKPVK